jgi:hypothetical protein
MATRVAVLVLTVAALGIGSAAFDRSASAKPSPTVMDCGKPPTPLLIKVGLPRSIPTLPGVVYTSTSGTGDVVKVSGFWKSTNLREAMRTYTFGLRQAGFVATDAIANTWGRVSFAKGKLVGYVELKLSCARRTFVLITLHPAPKSR